MVEDRLKPAKVYVNRRTIRLQYDPKRHKTKIQIAGKCFKRNPKFINFFGEIHVTSNKLLLEISLTYPLLSNSMEFKKAKKMW